jgi:hypothetical protein
VKRKSYLGVLTMARQSASMVRDGQGGELLRKARARLKR